MAPAAPEATEITQAIEPTPSDAPPNGETAPTTTNNGQKPDNFLKQILDASGMDLGEIAIAYGRGEDQGLSDAELKTKWRPRLQSYMKNPDRLKLSGFQRLMQIVGAEIVLKYSIVNRNEILVK
jgi:hypothetical protein